MNKFDNLKVEVTYDDDGIPNLKLSYIASGKEKQLHNEPIPLSSFLSCVARQIEKRARIKKECDVVFTMDVHSDDKMNCEKYLMGYGKNNDEERWDTKLTITD